MIQKLLTVINESGIHARPAMTIVETASRFECDIHFIKDGIRANAKSILNILLLAAEPGAQIRMETEGGDEIEAAAAIVSLFASKFHHE